MADLEKKGAPAGAEAPADGKMTDELQEKLKSLDKESNTMEYGGICGKIVAAICICFSLFQIYTGIVGTLDAMIRLVGQSGATVAGCCMLMELDALGGRKVLGDLPLSVLLHG